MELIIETMRQRAILIREGWRFIKEVIVDTPYFRAQSPDGWITIIDFEGKHEDWAITKAWAKRCEYNHAQTELSDWLREYKGNAGITYDAARDKFCASLFIKGGYPQESLGDTPYQAVANWKATWIR